MADKYSYILGETQNREEGQGRARELPRFSRNKEDRRKEEQKNREERRKEEQKKKYTITKSQSNDDMCNHGKRVQHKSSDQVHNPGYHPGHHPGYHPGHKKRPTAVDIGTTDKELNAATLNLLTPISGSSLGAVAWRRRDITKSAPSPDTTTPLEEVKLSSPPNAGSLQRIRSDLHKLGVRTSNHVTLAHRINVFDDSSWEEYGQSGDILIFDLTDEEDVINKRQNKTLGCEEFTELTAYPWRGRGRYNAEWSIKIAQREFRPTQVGKFEGGLYCGKQYNTKVGSSHIDKYSAFKVDERTDNPKIQKLIMSLGDTPDTETSAKIYANGKPDFYAEVDEIHGYLEDYKETEKPGIHLDTPPTNPYFDQDADQGNSDEEVLTKKSHHDFEVDPQTCWPCVGCQDDDVPKTMRWCSVM